MCSFSKATEKTSITHFFLNHILYSFTLKWKQKNWWSMTTNVLPLYPAYSIVKPTQSMNVFEILGTLCENVLLCEFSKKFMLPHHKNWWDISRKMLLQKWFHPIVFRPRANQQHYRLQRGTRQTAIGIGVLPVMYGQHHCTALWLGTLHSTYICIQRLTYV